MRVVVAVAADLPEGLTAEQFCAYVLEAVQDMKGCTDPDGPLMLLDEEEMTAELVHSCSTCGQWVPESVAIRYSHHTFCVQCARGLDGSAGLGDVGAVE